MNCPKPVLYFPVFKKIKSIGEIFVEVGKIIDKKNIKVFAHCANKDPHLHLSS